MKTEIKPKKGNKNKSQPFCSLSSVTKVMLFANIKPENPLNNPITTAKLNRSESDFMCFKKYVKKSFILNFLSVMILFF